jgi:hypothetical protein
MTALPTPTFCANHPTVETNLRCNRCEKPICSKCAILTPTGYRCQECVRNQQKVFDTAVWYDYILAIGIGFILSYIGSRIVSFIGFFTIFVAPIAGMIIAEAIRAAIRRRRSNKLFVLCGIAVALGALIPIIFWLIQGFLSLTLIWQAIYAFIVTSTVYYRLRGIRM